MTMIDRPDEPSQVQNYLDFSNRAASISRHATSARREFSTKIMAAKATVGALAFCFIASLAAGSAYAEGYATDDSTLGPYQLTTKEIMDRCRGRDLSHVDQSQCYYDQIKALRGRVSAAVKKRLIDADQEVNEGVIGGRTGAERAKLERAEIQKSQSAWSAYTNAVCGAIAAQTERGGGNGGDLASGACSIRHLVQRLNELTR